MCWLIVPCFFVLVAQAKVFRILQTNEDGWAETYTRLLWDELHGHGHDVVLSAPAEEMSYTGWSSTIVEKVREFPCQYGTCEPGAYSGYQISQPRLNWVNAPTITAAVNGIYRAQELWTPYNESRTGMPDLFIAGINSDAQFPITSDVDANLATIAMMDGIFHVPSIAFAGGLGLIQPWDFPLDLNHPGHMYAKMAAYFVERLIEANETGSTLLPNHNIDDLQLFDEAETFNVDVFMLPNTIIVVNFLFDYPACGDDPKDYHWILTRSEEAFFGAKKDAHHCGRHRLPIDYWVMGNLPSDCIATVSMVMNVGRELHTVSAARQNWLLSRMGDMFTCVNDLEEENESKKKAQKESKKKPTIPWDKFNEWLPGYG